MCGRRCCRDKPSSKAPLSFQSRCSRHEYKMPFHRGERNSVELAAIEKGFESINELKGIQSCHCIKKAGSSSFNMFLNSGDDIPFKTKVGILESKVNGFSKSSVTFIELEKYFSGYYNDNWYI
ncbi:hypothetical protein AVEN_111165-1 [Araneus ventricosus]|uniref:Uncharacterized protein n=1 Tax=Araneus ventricosus TaxID=182803 RepID=A0A4Y2SH95_ARAVE|nr:hypothetical protein AVEN_111165-1 [Araneus ventricosus]